MNCTACTTSFNVYASGDKSPFCFNLRTLLMVYGFYHDLDMIECVNICDEDLRLFNYFSDIPLFWGFLVQLSTCDVIYRTFHIL